MNLWTSGRNYSKGMLYMYIMNRVCLDFLCCTLHFATVLLEVTFEALLIAICIITTSKTLTLFKMFVIGIL